MLAECPPLWRWRYPSSTLPLRVIWTNARGGPWQLTHRSSSSYRRLIADLTPENFDITTSNEPFGELTLLQWLRSYYWHDRQHMAQINGDPSAYAPRFLSGQEPDQRLRR